MEVRLLILDDNPTDAQLMERELNQANIKFRSKLVETKDGFIKALEEFRPDLILADYSLTAFTGLDALQLLQDSSIHTPLIIVTGSLDEETAVLCIKAGADDYVIKEHLVRLPLAVKSALEKKEMVKERTQTLDILKHQNRFLNDVLESLTHPFIVVSANDYTIKKANSAARKSMDIRGEAHRYDPKLYRFESCENSHICPIEVVITTKQETVIERIYQFKGCAPRVFEVHSYPIFGEENSVTQVIAYFFDITDRKKTEEQIKRSLEEKEILLKEVYHRVKNNLQVISSLINLQSQSIKEDSHREMFLKNRNRIQAMALMHEKLCQSHDLTRIDFVKYIHDLMAHLFCSYGVSPDTITLKITVNDILLDINTAIPCGLIVNELVSNSLKHAFSKNQKGEVAIALFAHENRVFNLIVSDNGSGFPKNLDFENANSLGLQLVKTLAHQLGGEVNLDRRQGTTFRITFTPAKDSFPDSFEQIEIP